MGLFTAEFSLRGLPVNIFLYLCVMQPCPPRGSCAITDRFDGYYVFGCRCVYGYGGPSCEEEYMGPWMRLLAQGALVLSNFAMLPSFFLCMRLAVRHIRLSGHPPSCGVCAAAHAERKVKKRPLSRWETHRCFILHAVRAFAYFNACKVSSFLLFS